MIQSLKSQKSVQPTISKLTSATNALKNIIDQANPLLAQYQEMNEALANQQEHIDREIANYNADLNIALKQDQQKTFVRLAKELGYSVITIEEHADLTKVIQEMDDTIESAIVEAQSKEATKYGAIKRNLESKHELEIAKKEGENNVLRSEIESLANQVEFLQEQVKSAREMATQMVADATRSNTVVNTGK